MGDFCQSGQHNLKAILDRGKGDNTIGSFWVEEACTAAWTCGQSGRGTTREVLYWPCALVGTTVDCNGGRRGRTTFKYVTGKVTITIRVGRLSTGV